MPEILTLGLAQPQEAERIARMSRDLIEAGLGWSWTPQRVGRHIADRHSSVVVARSERRIAGFALMKFGDDVAHLNLLAVMPAWRRQGCGRKLMDWLFATAEVAGIRRINLELRVQNLGARSFYEACGFRVTGTRPNYYQGTESALSMSRGDPSSEPGGELGGSA
jgi:ribosomal-protein-alanine N-acetyltransferase